MIDNTSSRAQGGVLWGNTESAILSDIFGGKPTTTTHLRSWLRKVVYEYWIRQYKYK